jgi:hypothetical protein
MVGPQADNQRLWVFAGVSDVCVTESSGLSPPHQGNQLAVYRTSEGLRRGGPDVRDGIVDAARFSAGVAVAAVVFLIVATLWVSTCAGATFDTAACGAPQRTLLALGAPLILLAGGLRAFVRTYQVSRHDGISWPWHGAVWFLTAAMLLVLAKSTPLIAMP